MVIDVGVLICRRSLSGLLEVGKVSGGQDRCAWRPEDDDSNIVIYQSKLTTRDVVGMSLPISNKGWIRQCPDV